MLEPGIFRDQDKYYVGCVEKDKSGEMASFRKLTEGFWSFKEARDELQWISFYGDVSSQVL